LYVAVHRLWLYRWPHTNTFPPSSPNPALGTDAQDAIGWLLNSRTDDGRIPYIIHPWDNSSVVFQPITYSTESMILCDFRYPQLHKALSTLNVTVEWLISHQNADGSWGRFDAATSGADGTLDFSPSGDAERSPRALSLLQWFAAAVAPRNDVVQSIGKYVDFLLNATASRNFGVAQWNDGALVTGFVGLAIADLVQPWSTFGVFK